MYQAIHLAPVGPVGAAPPDRLTVEQLDTLAAGLARVLGISCHVRTETLPVSFAFDAKRNQHYSTAILEELVRRRDNGGVRLLGVTALDLFVPVLTFVFGEAQLGGPCALVSFHRLREEFYGLPPNEEMLRERLLKEALHELGHTFGLRHCDNWECVMASTHAVERLDLKRPEFCPACRRVAQART